MPGKSFTSILSFFAFLVFFLIGTLFFAVRYMDPNDYKADIAFFLLDATGRPVTMEGDISLEFFPWFGVRTGPVRIGNAPGFGPDEFLRVSSVNLRVKVLPFFKKKLVVDRVTLERPVLHLRRGRDGVSNWDDLIERVPKLAVPPVPLSVEAQPYFKGVEVLGVTMDNATVHLVDEVSGTDCTASDLTLRTGPIIPDTPLGVDVGMELSGIQPGFSGKIHLAGAVGGLWIGKPWLEHTKILIRTTLPGSRGVDAEFSGTLDYEALDGGFLLTECELRTLGQVFKGEFSGKGLLSNAVVNGTLSGGPFDPRKVWKVFSSESVFPADKGLFRSMSLKTWVGLDNSSLVLRDMHLKVDDGAVVGDMTLSGWAKPKLAFDLSAKDVRLDKYISAFSSDTAGKGGPLGCVRDGGGVWPVEVAGRLELGSQRIEGVDAERLVARIKAGAGKLTVDAGADRIFGGNLKAHFVAESPAGKGVVGTAGRSSLSLTARGINTEYVLKHFGLGASLSGKSDADVALETSGCGLEPLLRDGTGRVRIRMHEGGEYSGRNLTVPFASADLSVVLRGGQGAVRTSGKRAPEDAGASIDLKVAGRKKKGRRPFRLSVSAAADVAYSHAGKAVSVADATMRAALENGFLPRTRRTGEIVVRGDYDGVRDTLFVEEAELTALGLSARSAGEVRGLAAGEPEAEGTLRIPRIELRPVMKMLDIPHPVTRDPSVLKTASLSTAFSLDARKARASNMRLAMDGTELIGSLSMEGYSDPMVRFDLETGDVDLDRYRPPYKESPYDCTNPDPSPGTPLPLELLSSLRLDGDVRMRRFKVIGLEFIGMDTSVHADRGKLDIKTSSRNYFGGTFAGNLTAQASPRLLDTTFRLEGKGFDSGLFLIGLDDAPYVKGNADLFFNLSTHGTNIKELTGNLHGTSGFEVRDGSWNFMIEQAGKMDLTKEEADLPHNRRTFFDIGTASLTVDKGVFTNEDLAISGTLLSGSGYGNFSLPDDTIDLTFIITVGRTATVPVKVTGCLSDPEDHVPKGELMGGIAKDIMTLPLRPFQYLQELLFE